jgi:selenide,water dikinase
MQQMGVHAATDVTGFGLLGHLHEMVSSNQVGARIWLNRVPVLEEAWDLSSQACVPEGSYNNARFLQDIVMWDPQIPQETQMILNDAQTSGGLLLSVTPKDVDTLVDALEKAGTLSAAVIGEVLEPQKEQILTGQILVERSKK